MSILGLADETDMCYFKWYSVTLLWRIKYQNLDQLTALPNVLPEANLASHDISASFQLIWPTAIVEIFPGHPTQ
jgi:hypothetical protein